MSARSACSEHEAVEQPVLSSDPKLEPKHVVEPLSVTGVPKGSSASVEKLPTKATPVEEEKHEEEQGAAEADEREGADVMESTIFKMKGTRPEILRVSTYYGSAKNLYAMLRRLPVLSVMASIVEYFAESVINVTPLKPSTEQSEKKTIEVVDKTICDALAFADEVVDAKKDDAIEGIISAKRAIHSLGPVQTAMGVACDVGDGVAKAYDSANHTVGSVWKQAFDAAWNTFKEASTVASETITSVATAASDAANSTKSTKDETVKGAKCAVGKATNMIESLVRWAASTAVSFVEVIISLPVKAVHAITGSS